MSGLFGWRGQTSEPWFRLGRLEVGTVTAVVLAVAASWLAWVIAPSLPSLLAYSPDAVATGQVWRLVTWPLANGLSLWGVLNLFFFWYFGNELEGAIGRTRMLWLLVAVWGSLTAASTLVALVLGGGMVLAGIGLVQFAVLLLWIAEYPTRPFFFSIPAWVIGVVLVAVQAAGLLAARAGGSLLSLLLSLIFVAVLARRVGLLSGYAWIPGARGPGRPPARRAARAPRVHLREDRRRESARERLDVLLDRINEHGIGSLSEAERKELLRLRERLRDA